MTRFHCDNEEEYPNQFLMWERTCRNAIEGKRGRASLRELRDALLAMPKKRLLRGELFENGEVCAIGALAAYRAIQGKIRDIATGQSYEDTVKSLEERFSGYCYASDTGTADFASQHLRATFPWAWEVAFVNDERGSARETPEQLYERILDWVERELRKER